MQRGQIVQNEGANQPGGERARRWINQGQISKRVKKPDTSRN